MFSGPECMSLLPWLTRSCCIKVEQDKDIETSLSFLLNLFLHYPAVSKTNLSFTTKLIT